MNEREPAGLAPCPPLILVNARPSPQVGELIAQGQCPRVDHLELADRLDAEMLDRRVLEGTRLGQWLGMADSLSRMDFRLAVGARRQLRRHRLVISMWEWTGVSLALAARGTPVRSVMISHNLLSPYKRALVKWSGVLKGVSTVICLADAARQCFRDYYGLRDGALVTARYGVDQRFFRPLQSGGVGGPILSVGSSKRDYGTLLRAMEGLGFDLALRAASHWNPRNVLQGFRRQPGTTILGSLSFVELRDWYARAAFVVVPLRQTLEFTAGITTALEAAAMGKAVIATASPGMAEYVRNGETGILVPAGDPQALRTAIRHLHDAPREADRLGRNGRRWVEDVCNLDAYVQRLAAIVQGVAMQSAGA